MDAAGDDIRFNPRVVRGFVVTARIVAVLLASGAVLVLMTWVSGVGPLQGLVQSGISMRVGTAIGVLLAAAALFVSGSAPRTSIVLSLLVALLGGSELVQYAFDAGGVDWRRIGAMLPPWAGRPLERMTVFTAFSFVLVGSVGVASVLGKMATLRDAAALVVVAIAMASGAFWGLVLAGDSVELQRRMPIMSASFLLLLALGWMASVPTIGLTRIAVADSFGGAFARRLILPSLLLPVIFTFAFKMAQSWLGLPESLALALSAVAGGGAVATMIVWVAFLLDRSERQRRAVHLLRADASTDALTGVANRRAFDAALAQAFHGGAPTAALLMLDLDRFKSFNDSFGHPAGDEVLRQAGSLLRAQVRPQDLVARYGGEEFAILLSDADAAGAGRVAQRVLTAFRAHAWALRPATVSVGAAVAVPGDTPQSLLQRADAALYRSKQDGRDRCTFAQGDGRGEPA